MGHDRCRWVEGPQITEDLYALYYYADNGILYVYACSVDERDAVLAVADVEEWETARRLADNLTAVLIVG